MKILLDAHALLWFLFGDARLSAQARGWIEAPDSEIFVGFAAVCKIALGVGAGQLTISQPLDLFFRDQMAVNGFRFLPLTVAQIVRVGSLPLHSSEPFDRLLAAQSLLQAMPLVSANPVFDSYGVTRLW